MSDPISLKPFAGLPLSSGKTVSLKTETSGMPDKKAQMATEFERVFALQLVTEMTKGTFKTADNGIGQAGADLYRSQINETLATELARQGSLGIARMLTANWTAKENTDESR
jgi:Rod binding domain-containing protein